MDGDQRTDAVVVGILVVALIGAFALFRRDDGCHDHRTGANPVAAVRAFYDGCPNAPAVRAGPYDGHKETSTYTTYDDLVGFVVERRDGWVRFLQVGRRTAGEPWEVLSEGTGP